MKTLLIAATTALALGSAVQADEVPDLVTILTSGEPETQLMSMVLTAQSMQQGANAYVLLCGPAGDLALKDAPATATAPQKPQGMSPQGLMQKVLQSGAQVELCAIYLPNKGVDTSALLKGITVAKPPKVAARILVPDTQVMSF